MPRSPAILARTPEAVTVEDDQRFMAAAIRLSLWHEGLTATNPSVGCLVVKDGVIVGRAVTATGGRPHAETQALAQAGERARGATAYVTLEPCSHHGKTPPCADALVAAGIGRVVIAVTDPDTRVSGGGIARLRDAGIVVETGLLEADARQALSGYLMRQTNSRPYVTLKLAVSADGMLGRSNGGQSRITETLARAQVQVLRAQSDAILVGIGTALADDPELTVRLPGLEDQSPIRIVLDPRLELPVSSKLVTTAWTVPVIVVASEPPGLDDNPDPAFAARRQALMAAGVEVLQCSPHRIDELLHALASRGISSLLVEGGARVARTFLDAGFVDRILLFHGPGVIGAGGIESPLTTSDMPDGYELVRSEKFGPDGCDLFERGF